MKQPGGRLEQIEIRAAIHAAESLGGQNGKRGGEAVIERAEPSRPNVGVRSGVGQWRAFAQGTKCRAAFEKGDEPEEGTECHAAQQDPGCSTAWFENEADQSRQHHDQAQEMER